MTLSSPVLGACGLGWRRSVGRFGGIVALVLAALLGLMVFTAPHAEAKLTPAQTRLVKGLLGDSKAARTSANEFSSALLSANTESLLKGALSAYGTSMNSTQRALVELGALVDAPANRSLLQRMRAGKRLSRAQVRAAERLEAQIASNSAVKLLIKGGDQLLKNRALLSAEVKAQANAVSRAPASPPSTGNNALDAFSASIVRAERTDASRTLVARMRSLLQGATLAAYVKTLSPLEAGSYLLFAPTSGSAELRQAHVESGSPFSQPVDPSKSALSNAWGTIGQAISSGVLDIAREAVGVYAKDKAIDGSSGALDIASGPKIDFAPPELDEYALDHITMVELEAPSGAIFDFAGASAEALPVIGEVLLWYDGTKIGWQIVSGSVNGIARLTQSVLPSALLVTATGPPVFYADGAEGFSVQAVGEDPEGKPMELGTVPADLSIGPDGYCPGSICYAVTDRPHLVTATYDGAQGSLEIPVHAGAVYSLVISTEPAAAVTSVQEGVQQDFSVEGRDVHSNNIGPDTNAVLSVDPAVGSCSGFGCTFTQAGEQIVTATDGKAIGYYLIDVTGSSDTLQVTPQSTKWQVGVGNFVAVDEYNSAGQYVASVAGADLTITLTSTGAVDGACPTDVCTANTGGPHTITATYTPEGATTPITGSLLVTVLGPLDHLTLSPSSAAIPAGTSETYTVEGYDAANDDLGPDTGATLSISPDGSCTGYTCTPASDGDHTVTAADGTAQGTATLTVMTSYAAPCVFSDAGPPDCQSTDPLVTDEATTEGAAGCTLSDNIDWGDGSPVQTVEFTGSGPLETFPIAEYTYSTPGTYSITASAPVGISGPCEGGVGSADNYQFTLLSSGGSD